MARMIINNLAELRGKVGTEVAVSDWFEVTQDRINQFAAASGDFQWIHVDVERAERESPYGTAVAHGFLTLSLLSALLYDTIEMRSTRTGINYGLNRVRFTGPVPAGSRVRGHFVLGAFEDLEGGAQITWNVTVEREHGEKPVLVAEWLTRRYEK